MKSGFKETMRLTNRETQVCALDGCNEDFYLNAPQKKYCSIRHNALAYERSEKGRASRKRYDKSKWGKGMRRAKSKRYRASEHGKAVIKKLKKKYNASEKGKAVMKKCNTRYYAKNRLKIIKHVKTKYYEDKEKKKCTIAGCYVHNNL